MHYHHDLLNVFVCYFHCSNFLHIEDCDPIFDFTWNHVSCCNLVHEISACSDHFVSFSWSMSQNLLAIDYNNWSKLCISSCPIDKSILKHIFDRIITKWISFQLPLIMFLHHFSRHIILPLFTLQYSKNELLIIIISCWNCDVIGLAVFSEVVDVIFFFGSEFDSFEDKSLVFSIWNG